MPDIAVNVAVIQDGMILLTQREDFEVWCLPSGAVEEGESVAHAAVRETYEETGVEVALTRLVGVYSRIGIMPAFHAVLFTAVPIGGSLRPQPGETLEVRYFPVDRLPEAMTFGHRRRVADALSGVGGGVAVLQSMESPWGRTLSRDELYSLRDQSGISRQGFYQQMISHANGREQTEVEEA